MNNLAPHNLKNARTRSRHQGPILVLTAEELFEIWRSLGVRIYIDETASTVNKKSTQMLKRLLGQLAEALQMPKKLRRDFFQTYFSMTLTNFEHELFHDLIYQLGYEDEDLASMSGQELIDQVCEQYHLG